MKKNKTAKNYDILSAMRITFFKKYAFSCITALCLLLSASHQTYADTVISPYQESNGRIKTVSAGLIVIRDNGSDLTYRREVNNEYFGDAVMYKKYFFSRKTMQLMGRVENLDRLNAIIYTPAGKIEIQRYKIKDIIMKVPDKGY